MAFSFKIKKPVKPKKRVVDAPEDDRKMIETFSAEKEPEPEMVIAPLQLRTTIRRPQTNENKPEKKDIVGPTPNTELAQKESSEDLKDDGVVPNRSSILTNQPAVRDSEDPDENSYKEVPVEEFGAALLRGMGWKDNGSKRKTPAAPKSQRLVLGIGAKGIEDNDISQQLLSTKAKFSVPMVKRPKKADK